MSRSVLSRIIVIASLFVAAAVPAAAADRPATRAQALQAIAQPSAELRRAGVERLGDIGTMADTDRLVARLHDEDEQVRLVANTALWQIWGRSGDKSVDVLYRRGVAQMEAGEFPDAVATFTEIIRRKPGFAEAWNKRATLFYMMGLLELSLKDCDEVIKRNRNHFGALSGYGQIYLSMGDLERAATYLERALRINPNLAGAASTVQMLRERLDARQRRTI